MKFSDMLTNGASNLWKRKLRSALTIMGVVIGVASIVVMVSLGLGLSQSMMEEYASYGSMTQIQVETPYSDSTSAEDLRLTDALVADFAQMEHVESVYPVIQMPVISIYGGYVGYQQLRATTIGGLESFGIEVGEGRIPSESDDELTFFYGKDCATNFSNPKTGQDYWSTGVAPDIDFMGGSLFTVFDTNAYYASQSSDGTNSVAPPKKYLIPTCGTEQESEYYTQNSWYVFCDIEKLIPKLRQVFKKGVIPGQQGVAAVRDPHHGGTGGKVSVTVEAAHGEGDRAQGKLGFPAVLHNLPGRAGHEGIVKVREEIIPSEDFSGGDGRRRCSNNHAGRDQHGPYCHPFHRFFLLYGAGGRHQRFTHVIRHRPESVPEIQGIHIVCHSALSSFLSWSFPRWSRPRTVDTGIRSTSAASS